MNHHRNFVITMLLVLSTSISTSVLPAADELNRLSHYLDQSVQTGEVPGGALLLVHHDDTLFQGGFGYAHLRKKTPFESGTSFRVASLSKPIFATLVVKLAAEGIVDLDDPIAETLDSVLSLRLANGTSLARSPTLRECVSHTAGFRSDYSSKGVRPWLQLKHQGHSLADVVEQELMIPLSSNPGQKYAYSGIGYDVAARVVELATGQLIEDVLQHWLCEPLGMTSTTYYPDQATTESLPSFYWRHRSDGKFRRRFSQPWVPRDQYTPIGGGIVSTTDDLAKFLRVHQADGAIRSPGAEPIQWIGTAAIHEMRQGTAANPSYGLGFRLGPADASGQPAWLLHTGSTGTLFWCDLRREVIGVLATQHRFSDGRAMPESQRLIPQEAIAWPIRTKQQFIDPLLDSMM